MTPVSHRDAEERQEADRRGDREVGVGEEQRQRAADGGHDDGDQNEHGPLGGAEHGVEDEEDGQHGDGNDDGHALVGALLAFVFAGPLEVIAGGQFHVAFDLADGFFDG